MKKNFTLLIILTLPLFLFSKQMKLDGCWVGNIKVFSQMLSVKVCFENDSNNQITGFIDIPQQNSFNLKLSKVNFTTDSCYFELVVSPLNVAYFRGRFFNQGTDSVKVLGTFSQMGIIGSFELDRYFEEYETKKVQIPIYEEEVVVFADNVKLGGTFSRPKEKKRYPAIIFISGSGLQNRDEEIFGFKVFHKISDYLVLNGFATLRMDDRGVGSSTDVIGEGSSTLDFADDVLYLINFLKTRDDVDTTKIGLLGHSEGSIVAFISASTSKEIAFIISLSVPIIRGDSLILEQIKIAMKSQNVPDSVYNQAISDQMEIFEIVKKDGDFNQIRKILWRQARNQLEIYPENIRSQISEQLIQKNIQLQLENLKTKWFKTFITLDPMDYLSKVECPVLLLFGGKDTQVPSELMVAKLKKIHALKGKSFTIKVFPEANHLFQKAKSGLPSEYGILPKQFVSGFLETIVEWLKNFNK